MSEARVRMLKTKDQLQEGREYFLPSALAQLLQQEDMAVIIEDDNPTQSASGVGPSEVKTTAAAVPKPMPQPEPDQDDEQEEPGEEEQESEQEEQKAAPKKEQQHRAPVLPRKKLKGKPQK